MGDAAKRMNLRLNFLTEAPTRMKIGSNRFVSIIISFSDGYHINLFSSQTVILGGIACLNPGPPNNMCYAVTALEPRDNDHTVNDSSVENKMEQ